MGGLRVSRERARGRRLCGITKQGTPLRIFRLAFAVVAVVLYTALAWAQQAPAQPAPAQPAPGTAPSDQSAAPAKPVIVMPKLTHFEHAPYPPEAEQQGLQADVILKLTIDATGKVTAADVAQPAGHGFDEAAQQAALKFEFEPATRDGKPIPVVIFYKYAFTLTPKEQAPAPGQPAQPVLPSAPVTGNLGGKVRIAGVKAPVAGADVVIRAPDGTEQRLSTDAEGHFEAPGLAPGRYKIRVSSAGFEADETEQDVRVGEATEIGFQLVPEAEGEEVTITAERPPREVTRRTLQRREIDRIPGTGGDALRSIQSLPGVARPPGFAGLLIVRGSAPQDTSVFVDGALIPLVYHFGGLSSVVPTELLDRIDFYPGNFSSRFGRAMGGIVDVALREPDTTCLGPNMVPTDRHGCYVGMAQADLIDTRLMLQGPLGPIKGWTFAVAGRRSWFDVWLKPVLTATGASVSTAPRYYDYQLIAETRPAHDSRLAVRFFGSDDQLDVLVKDPAVQDPGFGGNLSFGTAFWTSQMLFTAALDPSVDLTTMMAVGKTTLNFSIGNYLALFTFYPINVRSEFGFKVARGIRVDAGMDFLAAPYDYAIRFPPPPRPGEPDPGPFVTKPPLERIASGFAFRPGWFTEAELQPHRRVRIVPGVRVDYARDTGHADFSPRINARYDLVSPRDEGDTAEGAPRRLRTTLKGGVGVYRQPPQFLETDAVFGTLGLESNRAIHYSLGAEQEFSRQIELSVEGFYKDFSNLVSRQPALNGTFLYGNDGVGSAIGLETLLKYKPDARFFGWLAYTLSRSVRRDTPNAAERLFEWDQTHNLTVLGSYRLGRGWEFGARFRVISGGLVTPVLQPPSPPSLYVADAGAYTALQGKPFSQRLPLFHQLDLRVDKHWQFRDWRLTAYLDVQNAYNHQAVEALAYNYNFSQHTYQTGIPIIPSIGLRGDFCVWNGTSLLRC